MVKEAVRGTHVCKALPQQNFKVGPVPRAELDSGTLRIYVHTVQGPLCMYNTTPVIYDIRCENNAGSSYADNPHVEACLGLMNQH